MPLLQEAKLQIHKRCLLHFLVVPLLQEVKLQIHKRCLLHFLVVCGMVKAGSGISKLSQGLIEKP